MNAYELANLIGLCGDGGYNQDAANMLRQQADLIRNLQKSLGFKNSGYETINLTPQTKPLSEKELYEVFNKCYPNNGDGDVVTLVDFARAIEERHGIK
jgi:hypothetical protein